MSLIHIGGGVYHQLIPPTVNEVWELCVWDEIKKELIRSVAQEARLFKIGTRPGLPRSIFDGAA